jgi:hypothetical protein
MKLWISNSAIRSTSGVFPPVDVMAELDLAFFQFCLKFINFFLIYSFLIQLT